MSREILVSTPENIQIEFELAGAGSRAIANLLDTLFQIAIYVGVIVAFIVGWIILVHLAPRASGMLESLSDLLGALMTIAFFLIFWGYFIGYELRWNGQTPGKRAMGLRVIRDGGYPVNAYCVVTRNLLRVVDGMPLITAVLLLIGLATPGSFEGALAGLSLVLTLLFLLFSQKYQRVGDMVAGTMVVKQRAPRVPAIDSLAPLPRVLPEHLAPAVLREIAGHIEPMTPAEYRAVKHTLDRRFEMDPALRQSASACLAVPLMHRLGIQPPPEATAVNYADVLEYLAVAYEQRHGAK